MINKRHGAVLLLFVCIVYGAYHLRCSRVVVFVFQTDSFTEKEIHSSHWLIINPKSELNQYVKDPQQNMSVILTGGEPCPDQWSTKNIICVNIGAQRSVRLRSVNSLLIAYLFAIEHGARFIYEYHPNVTIAPDIQHIAFHRARSPFVNILPTFTANAASRSPGLPTDELKNISQDGWSSIRTVDRDQERIQPLILQQIDSWRRIDPHSSIIHRWLLSHGHLHRSRTRIFSLPMMRSGV